MGPTMTNLSPAAEKTLAALRSSGFEYRETHDGKEWGGVYLDNAIPQDRETRRSLPGLLSALTKAVLYKQVDGFVWGEVLIG